MCREGYKRASGSSWPLCECGPCLAEPQQVVAVNSASVWFPETNDPVSRTRIPTVQWPTWGLWDLSHPVLILSRVIFERSGQAAEGVRRANRKLWSPDEGAACSFAQPSTKPDECLINAIWG